MARREITRRSGNRGKSTSWTRRLTHSRRVIRSAASSPPDSPAVVMSQRPCWHGAATLNALCWPQRRNEMKKWPGDATGMRTFYDPIEHVDEIRGHPRLRIVVMGDPRDEAVPFFTQQL